MTRIPFLNLKKLHEGIETEIRAAMDRVLAHGKFINGPEVGEFECSWAGFCGTPDAVGCANGTNALQAILAVLGIGPGDEVILPSHTFVATAESIALTGAAPVFAEIDDATMLVDPASVESLITPRTRAIAAVHLYGAPAAMGELSAIADKHGLALIEDAAQAHGATIGGKKAGALGKAASFSFFPGKNLGAFGDAGAVTSTDKELARRVRLYVNHGREDKYEHLIMGTNFRLDTLQAAILQVKVRHLAEWNERRRTIARIYDELIDAEPFASSTVRRQAIAAGSESSYHLYVVRVNDRDGVRKSLEERGIGTGIHYPIPCHLQPSMADYSEGAGSLPLTEKATSEVISLPMCPTMTADDARHVIDTLREVVFA